MRQIILHSFILRVCLLVALIVSTVNVAWATTYQSYTGGTRQNSTTISSSNVSSGSVGVISWTGKSCTYSSNRVNIAANGSITYTAEDGYVITKIVITSGSTSSYYGTWTSNQSGTKTSSNGTTTFDGLSANSVTVTTSTEFRCTSASSIQIHYASATAFETTTSAPTISGTTPFSNSTEVTISNAANAAGATIYYTTDGNEPTTNSTVYNGAFFIYATTTVKAIAKASSDNHPSSVVSKTFTKTVSGEKLTPQFDIDDQNVAYNGTLNVTDANYETDGKVTLSSGNTQVATIEGLTVRAIAIGSAKITINCAEGTEYKAGSAQFTLTVTAPEGKTTVPTGTEFANISFANNAFSLPENSTSNAANYTNNTYSIRVSDASYYYYNGALLMGKEDATLTLPAFDKKVSKIVIRGNSGASTKVSQNIFVGNTSVSTATTGSTGTNTYFINESYQTAGNIYKVKVLSDHNTQITSISLYTPNIISTKLNSYGYATFCSEYPLDFSQSSGYTAWTVNSITGNTITFDQVTSSVKGGVGVLLKGTAGTTVTLSSVASSDVPEINLLKGTTAPTFVEDDDYYGLSGNAFVPVNAGTVPAGKALLPATAVPAQQGGVKSFTFVFNGADGITTIENVQCTMDNDAIFNLAGQRMSKMQRGINIVNGKKILVNK